jgi:UDP-N-acetylmuramate--alanine ligase
MRALRVAGKVEPVFVDDIAAMPQAIVDNARAGDVVMCMGAGSMGAVPGATKNKAENNVEEKA